MIDRDPRSPDTRLAEQNVRVGDDPPLIRRSIVCHVLCPYAWRRRCPTALCPMNVATVAHCSHKPWVAISLWHAQESRFAAPPRVTLRLRTRQSRRLRLRFVYAGSKRQREALTGKVASRQAWQTRGRSA